MIDLRDLQRAIYANKLEKGFNVTDIPLDFVYLYGEVAEAYDAHAQGRDSVGEELADVVIYALGIAEMLTLDMEHEILAKMDKNAKRRYERVDGVLRKIAE